MCRIKLLFLDVEWNQTENNLNLEKDEILQIAAMGFSESYYLEKKTSRLVRPERIEDVKESTYKLLGLSENVLVDVKPLKFALKKFFEAYPAFDAIVVWNENTYDIFKYNVNRLGYKLPKHRVVVLQKVIGDITQKHLCNIGFERALQHMGIRYNKKLLHCAKNDVNYLQLLYRELYEKYEKICTEEQDWLCYSSVNSDIVHNANCRYIDFIPWENLVEIERTEIFTGRRVCSCCGKNKGFGKLEWKKNARKSAENKDVFNKKLQFDDECIESLCKQYGLECHIGAGVIYVRTGISTWRIYHNSEKVTSVYHQNYRGKLCAKFRKGNGGYHKQDIKEDTLIGVLRYIESHDKYFFGRDNKHVADIDRVFARISEYRR